MTTQCKVSMVIVLCGVGCFTACSGDETQGTSMNQVGPAGGTNYAFYAIKEEYIVRNASDAWWKPGVLNHVVGAFHMQPAGYIQQTLSEMYNNGQRKIALVLWHTNIESDKQKSGAKWTGPMPAGYEHLYGHALDSAGGQLCAQHQRNLKVLLALIQNQGFESVTIRFAAQGVNNPMEWDTWQEPYYEENLSFIRSVKQIADETVNGCMLLYYDLGLELGGLEDWCTDYTARLWRDYTVEYGEDDTIGFSFAVEPGRVSRMIKIYEEAGSFPVAFALDIYYDADKALAYVADEFHRGGLVRPPIIIQETFYNDARTMQEIGNAARKHRLNILYIMQWQVERDRMHWYDEHGNASLRHFSLCRPVEYANYLTPLY